MSYKVVCLLCASTLPFLFSLDGEFVFDDKEAIITNTDIYSSSWTDLFYHDFWGADIKNSLSHKSYRPLTILTFRLNYFFYNQRLSATQFKVTNLVLHISCCFLMWKTFDRMIKDLDSRRRPKWYYDRAYLATLIFAVHPVHTEAISGIVGRADLLAGNTFFLCLLLYQKSMTNPASNYVHFFGALLTGMISMLFKENGITALGVCLCYEIIFKFNVKQSSGRHNNKKLQVSFDIHTVVRIAGTVLTIFLLLFVRWNIMGGAKPQFTKLDNPAAFSDSLLTKILTYNYIYLINVVLLIWPQWLCFDWAMGCVPLVESLKDRRIIYVLLMYLYGLLVMRYLIKEKINRGTVRIMWLAIVVAVLPFLPASNIFYPVGFVVAERILYISSAGYCLFITLGVQKLIMLEAREKKKITPKFFLLLILMFSIKSFERAEDWRNEYQLYDSGLSVCPNNAKVHYNIGRITDTSDPKRSIAAYFEAIRLNPEYYHAMNNLGNALKDEKRYEEAEELIKRAISLNYKFPMAWMNLGILMQRLKRYNESEKAFEQALQQRSFWPDCHYNLGNLYLDMGRKDAAMNSWRQAVKQNETHALAWSNLLNAVEETGKGYNLLPQALKLVPHVPAIHFHAGNIYGKAGRLELAEKHFKMAIKLAGRDARAIYYGNLGVLYHRWDKHPLAEEMYKKALRVDPNFESAKAHLKRLQEFLYSNSISP